MIDSNNVDDDRTQIETQLLYDRSRTSAFDLLKLLVTLATAGVAGYFAIVTKSFEPSISSCERRIALFGLGCMAAAVFAGLVGWAADARFYERWAQSLQKEKAKGPLWENRHTANWVRRFSLIAAVVLFVLGLLLSGLFAYIRSGRLL